MSSRKRRCSTMVSRRDIPWPLGQTLSIWDAFSSTAEDQELGKLLLLLAYCCRLYRLFPDGGGLEVCSWSTERLKCGGLGDFSLQKCLTSCRHVRSQPRPSHEVRFLLNVSGSGRQVHILNAHQGAFRPNSLAFRFRVARVQILNSKPSKVDPEP